MARVWRDDIEVVGMSLEIAHDVGTDRNDLQPTRPRIIQREANNLASDATSFEGGRNLGVDESDLLGAVELILQHGYLIANPRLIATCRRIVANDDLLDIGFHLVYLSTLYTT